MTNVWIQFALLLASNTEEDVQLQTLAHAIGLIMENIVNQFVAME